MNTPKQAMTMASEVPAGMEAAPVEPRQAAASIAAGLRARVWIAARNFFSRADAQDCCWLWLLGDDGRVHALRMDARGLGQDDALGDLLARLDAAPGTPVRDDRRYGLVWPLPGAPVVPVPRWTVSWGHPLQQEIRDFAGALDADVLSALGRLEVPGPFLGSVGNYNRLATIARPRRWHRLQALADFPPLVAPVLLDIHARADLFGTDEDEPVQRAPRAGARERMLLNAIDEGRDLIGALARYHDVDRALVRSPPFREPWLAGHAPGEPLRLLDVLPAHLRPRGRESIERRLPALRALPVRWQDDTIIPLVGKVFAQGWDCVWDALEERFRPLASALRDTRDLLRAAIEQAQWPVGIAPMEEESLGLAWLLRRGLLSLLEASRRWHAQPLIAIAAEDGLPETLLPIIGERSFEQGRAIELITREELMTEGVVMRHCIGEYWQRCATDGSRAVHLRGADGTTATALYACRGGNDARFVLEQLRGPLNAEPAAELQVLATRIEQAINALDRRQSRLAAVEEAAILGRRCARDNMRRERRLLDRRSLGELGLVLRWCAQQPRWRTPTVELLRGSVAGFSHVDDDRLLDRLAVGDALRLIREPDNPHDACAVRVAWNDHKLGYVPRRHSARIAAQLDGGCALLARIVVVRRDEDARSPIDFLVTAASSAEDA